MSDEMKRELQTLKTDVAVLKTDVSALKTDVSILKTDVSVLKTDVAEIKTGMAEFRRRTAIEFAQLGGRIDGLEERFEGLATKDDVSRIIGHIVAFSRDVEAAQRDRASEAD